MTREEGEALVHDEIMREETKRKQEGTMPNHTPGPWEAHTTKGGTLYVKAPNETLDPSICEVSYYDFANARLIASAPQLLGALRELVAEFDAENERLTLEPGNGGYPDTGGMVLAREAIKAATE